MRFVSAPGCGAGSTVPTSAVTCSARPLGRYHPVRDSLTRQDPRLHREGRWEGEGDGAGCHVRQGVSTGAVNFCTSLVIIRFTCFSSIKKSAVESSVGLYPFNNSKAFEARQWPPFLEAVALSLHGLPAPGYCWYEVLRTEWAGSAPCHCQSPWAGLLVGAGLERQPGIWLSGCTTRLASSSS